MNRELAAQEIQAALTDAEVDVQPLPATAKNAQSFADSLPDDLQQPGIWAEDDGDIEFEWYVRPDWVFSVSVSSEGVLYYAGLFGPDCMSGQGQIGGDVNPEILKSIRRVYA